MKIKRVKLKDGITTKDLLKARAVEVDGVMTILEYIEINNTEFCIVISFADTNPENWNDLENITIIDTDGDVRSYFKTFNSYRKSNEDIPKDSKWLVELVSSYNRIVSNIPVLEIL